MATSDETWPRLLPGEELVVLEGTLMEPWDTEPFLEFLRDYCGVRHSARVIGTAITLAGAGGPGGRSDLLFAISDVDISFAVPRWGMRWWSDVVASCASIYPRDLLAAYPA